MDGGTMETFFDEIYTFNQKKSLPSFLHDGTSNIFNVRISNPNGGVDEQEENDFLSSNFEIVPDYPNEFNISINANNFGNENSWIIKNNLGDTLYLLTDLIVIN